MSGLTRVAGAQRKSKRKKYQSIDQLMVDVERMFENAKAYNLEDSEIYKDAVDLQVRTVV